VLPPELRLPLARMMPAELRWEQVEVDHRVREGPPSVVEEEEGEVAGWSVVVVVVGVAGLPHRLAERRQQPPLAEAQGRSPGPRPLLSPGGGSDRCSRRCSHGNIRPPSST